MNVTELEITRSRTRTLEEKCCSRAPAVAASSTIFPPPFFPASARIRVEQHGKGSRNRFQEQTEGSRNRAKKLRSGKMMKDPDDPVSKMKDQ